MKVAKNFTKSKKAYSKNLARPRSLRLTRYHEKTSFGEEKMTLFKESPLMKLRRLERRD